MAYPAVVDWSQLTSGLQTAFEGAVTQVLPIVGVVLAVFLGYRAIRRFLRA